MRVRWTRLALSQLDAIQDHVAQDNPVAAFELTTAIFVRVETDLLVHPHMGRVGEHFPDTRELIISEAPYIVVYRVREDEGAVEILRVRHAAQQWPPTN